MNKKLLWLSILAVAISFIGGFILANALNKTELEKLREENLRLTRNQSESPAEADLSADEIRQRIDEADRNPKNFSFQKGLGIALYRYGTMKKDTALLADVARILERAYELNPKDYEVLTALGNLHFDSAFIKNEPKDYEKARQFYEKALQQRPGDVDVRTDYAITFYLDDPPKNQKAIEELFKSLEDNPKHEKTLQFLIQALLREGKKQEAENYHRTLSEVNPSTPPLSEIEAQLNQQKNLPPAQ